MFATNTTQPIDWHYWRIQAGKVINVVCVVEGSAQVVLALKHALTSHPKKDHIGNHLFTAAIFYVLHYALQQSPARISPNTQNVSIIGGALIPMITAENCNSCYH